MIWEATLKPITVDPTAGEIARIRVQADNKDEAVIEVRSHAECQRCGNYAITKIEEVKL
jgi:hypothetical protein